MQSSTAKTGGISRVLSLSSVLYEKYTFFSVFFFECVCATVVTNLLVAFCGMSVCLFVCLPALSVCLPYYIFASLSLYVFVVRCLFSNCLFDCFLHLILHYFYC